MKRVIYLLETFVTFQEWCDNKDRIVRTEFERYRDVMQVVKSKIKFAKENGYRKDVKSIDYRVTKFHEFWDKENDYWAVEREEIIYEASAN